MKHIITLLFFVFSLSISSQSIQGFDCFSILVGKDASFDGSVMLAHNEDDYGERVVNILKVDRKTDHKNIAELKNGGILELGTQQNSIFWLEMPEMEFSDAYMNEYGVTIASDACGSKEDKPELTDGGIGYWLRRTMALKAKSSREAVKLGGKLVETYGYPSSGRTYAIADSVEVWQLSVVNGKHWVAQRVPDDEVAIIPNYYTISNVNLSDTMNFYGSEDLIDYAIERGWYIPDKNDEFSFRDAYGAEGNLLAPENRDRHWRSINMLAMDSYSREDDYPFSFKPKSPVQLENLFAVLRDHYENTELDLSENYQKGDPHNTHRGICASSTQYGFVAQIRSNIPQEIGNLMWLSIFRPCSHAFLPWYFGMESIPHNFAKSGETELLKNHFNKIENVSSYDPELKYFDFYNHALQIDEDYGTHIPSVHYNNYMLEAELIESQKEFEDEMIDLLIVNHQTGIKKLTEFVHEQISSYLKSIDSMEK